MIYFKTVENDHITSIGCCGIILPRDSIEISQEEFEGLVVEFDRNVPNQYGIPNDTVEQIEQDYRDKLAAEVAAE